MNVALNPVRLGTAARSFAHGDHASTYVAFAQNSAVPAGLSCEMIDLGHCNHFFCMSIAERLRDMHGCAVVLDTHDVQARQYVLRNAAAWCLPPRAMYESMLKIELDWLGRADLLLHLNCEEEIVFRALLPSSEHKLL